MTKKILLLAALLFAFGVSAHTPSPDMPQPTCFPCS